MVMVIDRPFVDFFRFRPQSAFSQKYFTQHEGSEQKLVQKDPNALPKTVGIRMDFFWIVYFGHHFTVENGTFTFKTLKFS